MLRVVLVLIPILFAAIPISASAQDANLEETAAPANTGLDPEWRFELRPYFFLSGVSGSVSVDPLTFPINSSFSSLLDNVKLGFFVSFAAEKGKWGIRSDFQYTDLVGESHGSIPMSLELKNIVGELDLSFRPAAAPTLRFVGGLRVYSVRQLVTIGDNEVPEIDTTVYDPVIGAMGQWELSDNWDFEMRGDIGGFGLSSEFTYQVFMLFDWHISKAVSVPFGYRILGYQIKKGDVHMNYRLSGLMLGVTIEF